MKLIIDIPEDRYKDVIEARKHHLLDSYAQAVANGTPIPDNATVCDIEQIRAEIENLNCEYIDYGNDEAGCSAYVSQDEVLRIIDRYTKGEEK